MHTEHLQNVRPSWIGLGWVIGAAVASLLIVVGSVLADGWGEHGAWVLASTFLGYLAGGYFVGARTRAAPILHAVGIGLFSLVFWVGVNLAASLIQADAFAHTPPAVIAGGILVQIVAAALGARLGSRDARAASR